MKNKIKNKSKIVKNCQICNSKKLSKILFLGYLPPVNKYIKINTRPIQEDSYPAELLYCKNCKLVQLGIVVDKKILFPYEYPYTSSTTKILRDNFQELFNKVEKKFNFKARDLVIDIGSNDGNLLTNFKNKYSVLGVTPEKIGNLAIKRGVPTIIDYFNSKTAAFINKKYKKAKIITATNVFAHMDDLKEIMKSVIKCLDDKGVFITESHYLIPLLKTVQYDTIYHEHLRYYTVSSLKNLFNKFNMQIFHVEQIKTHGGSIRVYCSFQNKFKVEKSVSRFLKNEKKYLNNIFFKEFENKVVSSKLKLLSMLSNIITNKKGKVGGISSPSRAATLINFTAINEQIVDCILEISGSYKIGCYVPGTLIEVKKETLKNLKKYNYLIIFSWHIYPEICSNLRKKGYKGKFIIPLPKPRIIN